VTKIFQSQFSSDVALSFQGGLHYSSFWGADADSLVQQGTLRNLFSGRKLFLTTGGAESVYRLGKRLPDGTMIGARGPYGLLAQVLNTPLHTWFVEAYQKRYGAFTSVGAYQTANGVLALKAAFDKAYAAKGGKGQVSPTEVIPVLKGLEYEGITSKVKMARAGGHQAVMEMGFGISKWDDAKGQMTLTNVRFYRPECIEPPEGIKSEEWIASGMNGAKCP